MPDEEPIPPPEDPDDLWIGQDVASYTIVRRVGEGGMGVIYLARHHSLDRMAAIKFLPAEISMNRDYIELFLREANAAAKLNHPNIISVYDAGSIGEGIYFFIMEYVEGRDLHSIQEEMGAIPVSDAVAYVRQAAAALAYAHKKHIVHRDIKPENILLTNEGIVKIADLGLAKWVGEEDSQLTQSGELLGSPIYISPERLRDPHNVDQRTDIYSLGATLFHLITGKVPYEGSSPVMMAGHLTDPVPNPRDIDSSIDERVAGIIMKMMAKKPEERYQSMDDVWADLQAFEIASGGAAVSPVAQAGGTSSSRRWVTPTVAGGLLLLVAIGYFFWPRSARQPPAPATSEPPPIAAPAALPKPPVAQLVVADFNEGIRENNLKGGFGYWNSESRANLGRCSESVEPGAGPDSSGCWRIVCGVSAPRSFGGTWMNLNRVDGRPYDTLSFKARSDLPDFKFSVECKTRPGATQIVSKQVVVRADQQWKTIEIPLKSFALPSLEAIDQVVFIFNQEVTGPKDAVLLIDDMVLLKK